MELCVPERDDFAVIKRLNSPKEQLIPSILTHSKFLSALNRYRIIDMICFFSIDNEKIPYSTQIKLIQEIYILKLSHRRNNVRK